MDCPEILNTSYGIFSEQLHSRIFNQRIPISGSLEVTARCNLRCAHCYIQKSLFDKDCIQHELSTEEMISILDQIEDAGCLWLLISGGEPLVRKDFLEIYTYAKKKGFLITLFTNGTLMTQKLADHLVEWPPFEIEITLYGSTQSTYEQVTGIPGSFKKCMQGIEKVLKRNLHLTLKTMVSTINQPEIMEMKKLAEDMSVEFRYDPMINCRTDGNKKPLQYRLSPEEIVAMEFNDEKRIASWQELYERNGSRPPSNDQRYQCGAALNNFHIDSQGHLTPCIMVRQPWYDLRQGSFQEGWDDFLGEVRNQKRTQEMECDHCELYSICDQCPGWAQNETRDLDKKVEFLCQTAHLRGEFLRRLKTNKIFFDHKQHETNIQKTRIKTSAAHS